MKTVSVVDVDDEHKASVGAAAPATSATSLSVYTPLEVLSILQLHWRSTLH